MKSKEIKEQIVYFLDKNKKYKKEQISKYIGKNIDEELTELELDGLIYKDKHELYSIFPRHLVQGIIHLNKNHGVLTIDKNKYKIKNAILNDILDGDLVIIKPTKHYENGLELATIEKILKRETGNIIVEVKEKDGIKYLEDINKRFKKPILLPNKQLKEYIYGDRLLVNIGISNNKDYYKAELIRYICNKDDPDKDIKTILVNNGFTIGHSEQSMNEVNSFPDHVRKEDLINRNDFRKILTISIDGKSTKDRDDAYSIIKLNNGNYLIIVHISAVSYYVKPGMSLWNEAMEKGTSVYPLDYVEPMFPKKLSNGICSLDEKVDRLTESHMIEIDKKGNIINYQYVPSVINSDKACTYEDVNKILEDYEMVEGYEDYYPLLKLSEEICLDILEKRMIKRGFLDFNSTDIEVSRNNNGEISSIKEKGMGKAQKIIEVLMVLTDELAALSAILPMIYRVHEEPNIEKVKETIEYLKTLGIKINYKPNSNIITAKQIQSILNQIKGTELEEILSGILIRTMKMAKYSAINIGHFALALIAYIQVTSPIRRAGDLWNQYYMTQQRESVKYTQEELNDLYKKAYILSGHLSEKEIKEEKVERKALNLITPRYYLKNKDEIIKAKITYLTKKYINIKTSDGIKGRLSLGDNYVFNKESNGYINKENNFKLVIGTPISVTPDKINEDNSLVFKLK